MNKRGFGNRPVNETGGLDRATVKAFCTDRTKLGTSNMSHSRGAASARLVVVAVPQEYAVASWDTIATVSEAHSTERGFPEFPFCRTHGPRYRTNVTW